MELKFNNKKYWELPKPTGDKALRPQFNRVTQVKFF